MNFFKVIIRKNSEYQGKISVLLGGVVIVISLLFSEGYSPSAGFFGSLPFMHVHLADAKYETKQLYGIVVKGFDKETVLVRNEIDIPLKYFLCLGLMFIFAGAYTYILSKPRGS